MTPDSTPPAFRYRAFISYSHQDKTWADWLHKALESYVVPKRLIGRTTAVGVIPARLAPIFRDRDELATAPDLDSQVSEALVESASLIVICSPHAAQSHWVNAEVLAFKRMGRSERLFCLVVNGEPGASELPGREADECFCPALRARFDASGQASAERSEPIAADARPGQDGKSSAKLKLIAGLLGLGLDELRLREHQRHVRRLSLVALVALLLMLLTSSLAVTAWLARQRAERQQSQAEGLVGFMLNDLDTKRMDASSRLSTLEAIGDRAMAYYASLSNADVNDRVLAGRARALKQIGSVRIDQGRLDDALASFQTAEGITAQLLARKPDDVERMTAQADSMTWIGTAHWYQGKLQPAQENFQAASAVLETASARRPGNAEIAYALAAARTNSGRVLEKRGQLAAAGKQYDAVLATFRSLLAADPDNTRWQTELGFAYINLGKLDWQRGLLSSSTAQYQADLAIKTQLLAQDPGNRDWQAGMALSQVMLGNALVRTGSLPTATSHLQEAVAIGQAQVKFDPDDVSSRDTAALYDMQLGRALRLQGQLQQARVLLVNARKTLSALAIADPDNAIFKQDLTRARLEQVQLELALDKSEAAAEQSSLAIASARTLLAANPRDTDAGALLARCLLLDGRAVAMQHKSELALRRWQEARQLIEPLAQSSSNPDQLDVWVSVLLLLDHRQAAAQPIARLAQMGYRDPDYLQLLADVGRVGAAPGSTDPTPHPPVFTPPTHKGESPHER